MCCILACCSWMIDLIQRLWTFIMSFCISSAVCCALVIVSVAGIALGYNYSLAEFLQLKDTNVTVYIKRGIFNEEPGEKNFRRSGQIADGYNGENNVRTGELEDENSPVQPDLKLYDSIYESEYRNNVEGPTKARSSAPNSESTVDIDKYSMDYMDRVKALQSIINMRTTAVPHRRNSKEKEKARQKQKPSVYIIDDRFVSHMPLNRSKLTSKRKFTAVPPLPEHNTPGNSASLALPQEPRTEEAKWKLRTYQIPVTQRASLGRPTRTKVIARARPTMTTASILIIERSGTNYPKSIDDGMDRFKNKLLYDTPASFNRENFLKSVGSRPDYEDYDEDAIRGLPVRKKRQIIV